MNKILQGNSLDVLRTLPDKSLNCCVTSPPYWGLRDYGTAKWEGGDGDCDHIKSNNLKRDNCGGVGAGSTGTRGEQSFDHKRARIRDYSNSSSVIQHKDVCKKCGAVRIDSQLGLEKTPEEYVENMVKVFREVKRVLRDDGTLWLNLGDSYSNHKDCKSTKQTIAKHEGHVMEKGISVSRDTKALKSAGLKNKDLVGIPWLVAFALRADGWFLRSDIIWHKPNPMPESVTDRPTKSHEHIFLLSKSQKYYYDYKAILEPANYDGRKDTEYKGSPKYENSSQTVSRTGGERWSNKIYPEGENQSMHKLGHGGYIRNDGKELFHRDEDGIPARNKRDVWVVNTKPYKEAHFAVFPPKLIVDCIKAGCPKNGVVLDPFSGSGTTALVARKLGRNYLGIELNPEYIKIAEKRLYNELGMFL